jgi:hypothetical protein
LKRIPAWAVTSLNSIGPEGRGGVGVGVGDPASAVTSLDGAGAGVSEDDCLQPEIRKPRQNKRQQARLRATITKFSSPSTNPFFEKVRLKARQARSKNSPLKCAALSALFKVRND